MTEPKAVMLALTKRQAVVLLAVLDQRWREIDAFRKTLTDPADMDDWIGQQRDLEPMMQVLRMAL